jgi:hypothetical protein
MSRNSSSECWIGRDDRQSNGRSLQFARRCAKHSEEKNGPWALTRKSKPSKESNAASSVTRLSANMACHQHSKQNHNPLLPVLLDMSLMFLDICMVFMSSTSGLSIEASRLVKSTTTSVYAPLLPSVTPENKEEKKKEKKSSRHKPWRSVKHRQPATGPLYRLCRHLVPTTMPSFTLPPFECVI